MPILHEAPFAETYLCRKAERRLKLTAVVILNLAGTDEPRARATTTGNFTDFLAIGAAFIIPRHAKSSSIRDRRGCLGANASNELEGKV